MAWNQKLLQTMRDPEAIVIKTDKLVAIKDKFPKARHHFLVLPHENIDSIYDLTKLDVELVKEMDLLSQNVIQLIGQKPENFLIGFHAEPSMARAHLHIVSKDFVSPCLKTKWHWNSFHTKFLWPVSKIISDLEAFGKVQRLTTVASQNLLNNPLKCNSCPYAANNMPDLKRHLTTHASDYE